MRIASIRRAKSLLQLTVMHVLVDKEEGSVMCIPVKKEESPSMGERQRWHAGFCSIILAFGRIHAKKMSANGSSDQSGEYHQASPVSGV